VFTCPGAVNGCIFVEKVAVLKNMAKAHRVHQMLGVGWVDGCVAGTMAVACTTMDAYMIDQRTTHGTWKE